MRWPNPTDYQDAVQNPGTCFYDPALKAGEPALTPLGLPRVASGNFASVYEIRNGTKRWAVRCFLRQAADQQRHYEQVSRHLKDLWLPFLVGFEYQPQGIRLSGQAYPIVRMQWVQGIGLHSYVKKQLRRPQSLLALAAQWRGVVNSLHGSRIAHGDLQHGNVMVAAGGQIRLVDYDAMFVPVLRGTPCAELGHANYQHPERTGLDNAPSLDHFAALVIYISLRGVAADPALWDAFHTGDNLLFAAADFKDPANSALFQRCRRSPDAIVRALSVELARACARPVSQLSALEALLYDLPPVPDATAVPVSIPVGSGGTPASGPVPAARRTVQTGAAPSRASTTPPATPAGPWWLNTGASATHRSPATSVTAGAAPHGPAAIRSAPTAGAAGQIKTNAIDGAKMVWVPEGPFLMGSNQTYAGEGPERTVGLDGFWIYRHTVTVAQYRKFCAATQHPMPPEPDWGWHPKHPIVHVSWDDALAYCRWAGVRLPTEAQWEKAARGTDGRIYPWGAVWNEQNCRCGARDGAGPVAVGDCGGGVSPYGVYNMAGNVSEWCVDWYDAKYYGRAPNRNPLGPPAGFLRVHRGGSWKDEKDLVTTLHRRGHPQAMWLPTLGFRCVSL
jgi:formylglycine-generating enzyme required for sulfatase activity